MRLRSMLIAAFAATAIPAIDAAPANAQTITSAQCVGGVIGCQQVDLFFTLVSGAPLDLHSFSLALFGSGWLFRYPTFVEAEDFWGLLIANGTLSADRMTFAGTFDPTDATLDPRLRLRAEFDVFGNDVNTLNYTFTGRNSSDQVLVSASTATTTTPEPASMLLMATGLGSIALVRRRRWFRS